VRWSSDEPGHAQLIAADGKLIGFNDRGEVLLFRASSERYEELGRVSIFPSEVCWTPPALADGRLYMRTQSRVACVYLGRAPLTSETGQLAASDIPRKLGFDPTVLIGAERDYPATKPDAPEIRRWFVLSLGAIVVAAALALLLDLGLRSRASSTAALTAGSALPSVLFFSLVIVVGAAGSYAWHPWREEYYFSWPLALWGVYQLAIDSSWHSGKSGFFSRERLRSYAVGLVFLAACALYFHLCRWLGLALEWCFLTGFVLSYPVAVACEYLASRPGRYRWVCRSIACVVSFAAYYWSSVWFMDRWLG
jgi:hypothetical protein